MLPNIVPVVESSQISEARRAGLRLAEGLEWDEICTGKLAIVLTEIGTNLVKHAKHGQMHLRVTEEDGRKTGIEILAFDEGPGITDIEECLADGYSTKGTQGTGLGAIARLTDEFDIYSLPGKGTCLVVRIFSPDTGNSGRRNFLIGAVQVPVRGETECGDNWGIRSDGSRTILMMADGLGHGPGAAQASGEAVEVLKKSRQSAPATLLEEMHLALRSTRGAAVAIANIDGDAGEVRFAGAGNISALVIGPAAARHMISHNGTAGHHVRKFQEFVYPWTRASSIVMHSDGIVTSWRLDGYPGLLRRDPALLAATLLRDASRGRDDACVLAGRDRG